MVDGIDAHVQVRLHDVEVAIPIGGDLTRHVALGDHLYIMGSDLERCQVCIQSIIDPLNDLLVVPFELVGISSSLDVSGGCLFRQCQDFLGVLHLTGDVVEIFDDAHDPACLILASDSGDAVLFFYTLYLDANLSF